MEGTWRSPPFSSLGFLVPSAFSIFQLLFERSFFLEIMLKMSKVQLLKISIFFMQVSDVLNEIKGVVLGTWCLLYHVERKKRFWSEPRPDLCQRKNQGMSGWSRLLERPCWTLRAVGQGVVKVKTCQFYFRHQNVFLLPLVKVVEI